MTSLMWFRSDLRVDDNSALQAAVSAGGRIAAVYYAAPEQWREHQMAPVKADFLWRCLQSLQGELAQLSIPLYVRLVPRFADIAADLKAFAAQLRCKTVFANREYGIDEQRRDSAVAAALAPAQIELRCWDDATLVPPGHVYTRQGHPFKVFTPFKRALLERLEIAPLQCAKARRAAPWRAEQSTDVGTLLPGSFSEMSSVPYETSHVSTQLWPAGEAAAAKRLRDFIRRGIGSYKTDRDMPARAGTSALSPYLALGVISIRRCAQAALAHNGGRWSGGDDNIAGWLNELLWREFYLHVLAQFPRVSMNKPMRPETEQVHWRRDADEFAAWCAGRTGFPLVDAGMRQLLQLGWMHNRLRMVTAMFLSKYLLLDWRWGEAFFMRHLIDGDLASNNGGWQWCASTGSDAAPYFRLLQPVRQAERFDPDGEFCRRFVPELQGLPAKVLLQPGHPDLIAAGYPPPLVDLKTARERALQAFAAAGEQHRAEQACTLH